MLVNTQDSVPRHQLVLSEVGISNLKTLITINRKNGGSFRFITTVDVTINLPADRKGAHMSRLVESISEIFLNSQEGNESIEMLNERALTLLREKHPFLTGSINIRFDFAWYRKTPVTNRESLEVYPISVHTILNQRLEFVHRISVVATGSTACPHALAVADGKRTHIQRAVGTLTVTARSGETPSFEDLISVADSSFSAPTFSVLKTEDEEWVVRTMFEQPFFCEDVTRNLLVNADNTFSGKMNFMAEVRSEESIHKHDVIAKGTLIRDIELDTAEAYHN